MSRRLFRPAVLAAAALTALVAAGPVVSADPGGEHRCAEPVPGHAAPRATPEDVGMDAAVLTDALDFGTRAGGIAVQVYRHGCLVGDRTPTANVPLPLASATKGVTSAVVGRAVTLGRLDVDDPLGKFFPRADPAHANLTVRQVLTQTTGLHFSWPADLAGLQTDAVGQTLAAPADHAPDSTFQYAQNTPMLLAEIVEIATGVDFQGFAQRELFAPLGIDRANWVWLRDRSGNTAVNGGLAMRPDDLARLGRLLLQEGRWGGEQLIAADYLREATTGTAANPGYGFLTWLNSGDTYRGTEVPTAVSYDRPQFPGSPRDMYSYEGALGQFLTVIPSRDLVVVRLGVPLRVDLDNPVAMLTGSGNPDNKELFQRVTRAVTGIPAEPYVDPLGLDHPPLSIRTPDDLARLADPGTAAAILLGVGPYASTGCNILWCDGSFVAVDVFRLVLDVGGQVAAAVLALGNAPR
ncbi:serine hydrolase domain-containing protein [Nocardia sp. NPDC058379]|uniref:serine hydrolase domain-containing protein n=1 Tax=unclassified Nocardia TaxID=2637762 RepID=UPI00364B7E9E